MATTIEERAQEIDALSAAAERAKAKLDFTIIWGSGHVAGQAYNLTGSSGVIHGAVDFTGPE